MSRDRIFASIPRIYVSFRLNVGDILDICDSHFHYLKHVLRLKNNDQFRIFNSLDGEFLANVRDISKNTISAVILDRLRVLIEEKKLTLALSIIKMDKMLDAISMAVQLGVTKIVPLIAQRSQFRNVNKDRINKIIIESTEQCERLDPAILAPTMVLTKYREYYPDDFILYANEYEQQGTMFDEFLYNAGITLIIGPEGGFTNSEIDIMSSWNNAKSISLGSHILRAETAAASGLTLIASRRK